MKKLISVASCFWLFFGLLEAENGPQKLQEAVESGLQDLLQSDSSLERRDPIACSADSRPLELTDYSGWFVSPEYPEQYPNNANCQWLIRSQEPGGVLEFDFTYLQIEASYDGIFLFDGPTTQSPRIAAFDGPWNSNLPTGIRSTGDTVLVLFFSDGTIRREGFNVSYTSDVVRPMSDPCYPLSRPVLVNEYSGSFNSNNYPSPYWSYSDCSWLVESQEPGGILQFNFTFFATNSYDTLYLYDGPNAQAPKIADITGYYGLSPNLRYTTTQNYLFARFIADSTGIDRGFNAVYTSVPAAHNDQRGHTKN